MAVSVDTYKQMEIFESVCANPYATARAAAERGEKVAGYMCTYTPVELLDAAGYFPVRLLGREGAISQSGSACKTAVPVGSSLTRKLLPTICPLAPIR